MHSPKRVRIQDVAAATGVSPQTVSRVLNNKPDVAEDTRQRILQVIEELDYQPNLMARGLVSNRTFTLGMITDDFGDPFFAQIITAAEKEARNHNYYLLLCSTDRDPTEESRYFRLLSSRPVDGVLVLRPGPAEQSHLLLGLIEQGIPVVPITCDLKDPRIPLVDVDNLDGGYQAVRYLLDLNHRRIGMITGPAWNKTAMDRTRGYTDALREAGIPFDPNLVAEGDWTYEGGYNATRHLLSATPDLTAIFLQNDRMAIAAMQALRESGRSIPGDVSIVGYDDIREARFANPPLTTIHQPAEEIGRTAANLLIKIINDPAIIPSRQYLKTELVYRESCAPFKQSLPVNEHG